MWSADDVRARLSDEEWAVAAPYWGLDRPPNFEQHAWNLRVSVIRNQNDGPGFAFVTVQGHLARVPSIGRQ